MGKKFRGRSMSQAPAQISVEGVAVAYARDAISALREPIELLGVEVELLSSESGRDYSRRMLRRYAMASVPGLLDVVDWARAGWALADETVRAIANEYAAANQPAPPPVAAYTMEVLDGRTMKIAGRRHADTALRDIGLASMVWEIAERFDIPPTGRSARRTSACEIVAQALGDERLALSESAVKEAWRRYGRALRPDREASV
jgi:hypothetical protein